MSALDGVVPVILSGGAGSRLWPLSTDTLPKQFMTIFGDLSLFQRTVLRFGAASRDRLVIVANAGHRAVIEAQLSAIDIAPAAVILEPFRRDSAAAVVAAAEIVEARFGADAVMAAVPSDALIRDVDGFRERLGLAVRAAQQGHIAMLGVTPTRAATEFGYIQIGAPLDGAAGAFAAARFVEKPSGEVARGYLASGDYLWNSGMFIVEAGALMAEARAAMPEIVKHVAAAIANGVKDRAALTLDAEGFGLCPSTSIDYGLIEKVSNTAVVPVAFDWSDVGNWRSAGEALGQDPARNTLVGDVVAREASDVIAISHGLPIRLMGVAGIAIIASSDGVLVVPVERSGEIKALLEG